MLIVDWNYLYEFEDSKRWWAVFRKHETKKGVYLCIKTAITQTQQETTQYCNVFTEKITMSGEKLSTVKLSDYAESRIKT